MPKNLLVDEIVQIGAGSQVKVTSGRVDALQVVKPHEQENSAFVEPVAE